MEKEPKKRSNFVLATIISITVGVIVGMFIAAQIRTTQSIARSPNPVQPSLELADTIEKMKTEQAELKNQISILREDVDAKEETIEERRSTSKEISTEVSEYKELVGLTEMKGQGVIVKLDDGTYDGLKDRNDFANDAIIHSTDILDVVNILWAAGAEVISINNERVVNTTSINCIVNTILVNESHVGTPLEIKAIGEKDELARFINDPGRLIDLHKRKDDYGLVLEVSEQDELQIESFTGTYEN